LVTLFSDVLSMLAEYKKELAKSFESKKNQYDGEEVEMIQEYVRSIEKIWDHIMEICSVMHRTMPEAASPEI